MKRGCKSVVHVCAVALLWTLSVAPLPAQDPDMSVPGTGMGTQEQMADVVETAMAAGNFTTLTNLLQEAGLVAALKAEGPFTIFAPTDEAFAKLPANALDDLRKDKKKLTNVLLYHVVKGIQIASSDITGAKSVKTMEGSSVKVNPIDGRVMVDSATVVQPDVQATNGVIHAVDMVLMPRNNNNGMKP